MTTKTIPKEGQIEPVYYSPSINNLFKPCLKFNHIIYQFNSNIYLHAFVLKLNLKIKFPIILAESVCNIAKQLEVATSKTKYQMKC